MPLLLRSRQRAGHRLRLRFAGVLLWAAISWGSAHGQPFNWPWSVNLSGSQPDEVSGLALDAQGNTVAVGYTRSSGLFPGAWGQVTGSQDAFVARYNASGAMLWALTPANSGESAATAVTVDAAGNVYACGWFKNSVSFIGVTLSAGNPSLNSAGNEDWFIASWTPDGELRWATRLGGGGTDRPVGIGMAPTGPVVLGTVSGRITTAFGSMPTALPSNRNNLVIAKFSTSGAGEWLISGGSGENEVASSLAVEDNAVYASYHARNATCAWYGPNGVVIGTHTSAGNGGIRLSAFAGPTNVLWTTQVAETSDGVFGPSALAAGCGALYITGMAHSPASFPGAGSFSTGTHDLFYLARVNPGNGQFQWVRTGSTTGSNHTLAGTGLALTSRGTVLVSGQALGGITIGGVTTASANTRINPFVAAFLPNGQLARLDRFSSTKDATAPHIAALANGRFALGGGYDTNLDYGSINLSGPGNLNGFIATGQLDNTAVPDPSAWSPPAPVCATAPPLDLNGLLIPQTSGYASVLVGSAGTVSPAAAVDGINGAYAGFSGAGNSITVDLGLVVPAGGSVGLVWRADAGTATANLTTGTSLPATVNAGSLTMNGAVDQYSSLQLATPARYVTVTRPATGSLQFRVDAVVFSFGNDLAGAWSGPGVSGSMFNPMGLSGAIPVTYTVGSGVCASSTTRSIQVDPGPNAGGNGVLSLCASAGSYSLFGALSSGPQPGGTWTGPSTVSGGLFDAATMSGGSYTYTVPGTGGCTGTTSSASVQVILGQPPSGGTFTGTGTVCPAPSSGTLSITGHGGSIVQWQWTDDGVTWNNTGVSTPSLAWSNLAAPRRYRVELSAPQCPNGFSSIALLAPADTEPPVLHCPAITPLDDAEADAACSMLVPDFSSFFTASDNCTSTPLVVQTPAAGTLIPFEEFTVITVRAIDAAGNPSDACQAHLIGIDPTPPIVTCPSDTLLETPPGSCLAQYAPPGAPYSDNCWGSGMASRIHLRTGVHAVAQFAVFDATGWTDITGQPSIDLPPGQYTLVNIIHQGGDAIILCGHVVTVVDHEPPAAACPPVYTLLETPPGACHAAYTVPAITLADNCSGSTSSQGPVLAIGTGVIVTSAPVPDIDPDDALPAGTELLLPPGLHQFTDTLQDAAGNMTICNWQVEVRDATAPLFVNCPGNSTIGTAVGQCSANYVLPSIHSTDACDADTESDHRTWHSTNGGATWAEVTGSTAISLAIGNHLFREQHRDEAGNAAECTWMITVTDQEPPVIACPTIVAQLQVGNNCLVALPDYRPNTTATDNCGPASLIQSPAPGTLVGPGMHTIVITAMASGLSASCSFTVPVVDAAPPVLVCPLSITVNAASGSCGAMVTYPMPTGTDNCGTVTVTRISGPASGSTFPVGSTIVTHRAVDAAGLSAECTFTITVVDNIPPVFSGCPSIGTVNSSSSSCGAVVTWTPPTVADNCSGGTMTLSSGQPPGSFFPVGMHVITYAAVDASGNLATCSFGFQVADDTAPVFTSCPDDIVVHAAPGMCSATVAYPQPVATDNCGPVGSITRTAGPASGSAFPVGTTAVTHRATDAAGQQANCTFWVTVLDAEAPLLNGCMNVNASAGPSCDAVVNYPAPTVSGNCAGCNGTAPINAIPLGSYGGRTYLYVPTTVNWAAANNAAIAAGGHLPIIRSAAMNAWLRSAVTAAAGGTAVNYWLGLTDAAVQGAWQWTNGTALTYSNWDTGEPNSMGGNEDYAHVRANGSWNDEKRTTAMRYVIEIEANCNQAVLISGLASGSTFSLGSTTVTYAVVDAAGNTSSCSFLVNVSDNTPPVINCPADITVNAAPGSCTAVVSYTAPVGIDNCSGAVTSLLAGLPSGSAFPIGPTTITYRVTAGNGQSATCSFTITVVDATACGCANLQPGTPCDDGDPATGNDVIGANCVCAGVPLDCTGTPGGSAFLDNCSTCVGGTTGLSPCSQDCAGVWGGTAFLDNCNTCVGGTTGLSACSNDCAGVPGGSAYMDNCGTCVGGTTGLSACVQDCAGVWGGSAYLDNCNTCVGGTTGLSACVQDCAGVWGGSAYLDNCSTCVGGTTGLSACSQDCAGVWGGTAFLDNCNTCVGGSTGLNACTNDCAGVPGGSAYMDNCGTCVGGTTGLSACVQDCAGVWGGSAYLDNCSTCVGGTTGLSACSQDCAGVWGGTAFLDNCNTCVGGSTGLSPCSQDCAGVWGGTAFLDNCNTCVGGSTGLSACGQDCAGVWGGTAFLDNCSTCVGGTTGLSPCSQDCAGVWGGTAFLDNCSICVGGTTGLSACSQDCAGMWGGTAFLDNCNTCVGGTTGLSACSQDCAGVWGGTAFLDNCSTCVGGTTGLSACGQDCAGVWGGTAFLDNCSTCVGGTTGLSPCSQDCAGVWGGSAFLDNCNACVGGSTGLSACAQDCAGVWGGTAFLDNCNTCVGGTTGLSPCSQDCAGMWGGTAFLDNCNTCVGGNTGLNACAQDCAGVWGGTAFLDNCSTCVGGTTGLSPCSQDCAGVWGGTAFLDNCNTCVGGSTGLNACTNDCAGVPGGSAYMDNCGTCVGGTTGLSACVQDCAGVWGGTAYLDNCSTCVGGTTGLSACGQDCAGVWGGTAFLDNCGTCVGGNTGLSACSQDCAGVWGGTAFLDNCNTCVGGSTGLNACAQDCAGVWGGSAFPGMPCDDGDANTSNDVWATDCTCAGTITNCTSDAGVDQTICGWSTVLAAAGNGSWSVPSGITVSSPSDPAATVTAMAAGAYALTWTVAAGGCTATDTVNITFLAVPDPDFAYAQDTYCQSAAAPTPWVAMPGGSFSASPAGLLIETATGTIDVGQSAPGTYQVMHAFNGACPAQQVHQVTIVASADAGWEAPSAICSNAGPITLASLVTGTPGGLWSGQGVSNGLFSPSGLSGAVTLTYEVSLGSCQAQSTQSFVVNAPPMAQAGVDAVVCGFAATLQAVPTTGATGSWTVPTGISLYAAASDPHAEAHADAAGTYALIWTATGGACSASDTVLVSFIEQVAGLWVDAGPDQHLAIVGEALLQGQATPGASLHWWVLSGSGDIASPTDSITGINGLGFGDNLVVLSASLNQCSSVSDTVLIHLDDLFIPEGFSPNGDGVNDRWEIRGIEAFPSSTVAVFNRWGKPVLKTNGNVNGWDGRSDNGQALPDDTYFYVLNLDGQRTYNGHVIIKR